MKKIYLLLMIFGLIGFASCDPIDDGATNKLGYMTAEQINATVNVLQEDGKNVNKVEVTANNPLPTQISNGVNTIASSHGELLLFGEGENKIYVTVLNPDGKKVTKEISVNVEKMFYEVPPQYGFLCGKGEKTWVWDSTSGFTCWGNFGYISTDVNAFTFQGAGGWWGTDAPGIKEQIDHYGYNLDDSGVDATMTFQLNGTKIIKSSGGVGTFSFDMSKGQTGEDGTVYSVGKFYTSGASVLFPVQINTGNVVHEFDIITLDENNLVLMYANPGAVQWNEATYWRFKAQ